MRSLLLAAVVLLAACGSKGGLTLPPAKLSAVANPVAPSAADNNSRVAEAGVK